MRLAEVPKTWRDGDEEPDARRRCSRSSAWETPTAVSTWWSAGKGGDAPRYKYHVALLAEIEAVPPEWRPTLLIGITIRGPPQRTPCVRATRTPRRSSRTSPTPGERDRDCPWPWPWCAPAPRRPDFAARGRAPLR